MKRPASVLAALVGMQITTQLKRRPGSSGHRRSGPKPLLTDAQIIEARRMHEQDGKHALEILRHFGLGESESRYKWMVHILNYDTRSSPHKPLDPMVKRSA